MIYNKQLSERIKLMLFFFNTLEMTIIHFGRNRGNIVIYLNFLLREDKTLSIHQNVALTQNAIELILPD